MLSTYIDFLTLSSDFFFFFGGRVDILWGMDQSEFMTSAEVEKYLAISRTTLWKLRLSGELRFVRYRRKIYYRKGEIEKFVEEHSFGPK